MNVRVRYAQNAERPLEEGPFYLYNVLYVLSATSCSC